MDTRRVAILFGGKSAEHDISLLSARGIVDALDPEKYEVFLIGINREGQWLSEQVSKKYLATGSNKLLTSSGTQMFLPGGGGVLTLSTGEQVKIDVAFPVLHGTNGEDGTVQGLLKLAGVPFVGAGVLGSAVGMDKDVMKRLLRDADIPIAKFMTVRPRDSVRFKDIQKMLGLPLFVKPANAGSSVGISKVRSEKELKQALALAFSFDEKILIEECIEGREIECAVLGNDKPTASVPAELVIHHEFYSYEAKYLDENGMTPLVPARLPGGVGKIIRELAIRAYRALECEGMGRVDFFLTKRGKVYVNEINTIPGFTRFSMYPKMWEKSGLSYSALVEQLIELALDRHRGEQQLKTSRVD